MTKQRWEILQRARRKAARWLSRPGVVGIAIGQRHREGRWVAGAPCIVVKVEWKLHDVELRRRRRASIPRAVAVTWQGRRHIVPVDVQETRGERAGRCQGVVAASVSIAGVAEGAVGAVVSANGALKALVAGHVVQQGGVKLAFGSRTGTSRDPFFTSRLDHCVIDPDQALTANDALLVDGNRLTGVRAVASLSLDSTLYLHHAVTGTRIPTVLRHVDASAPFLYPSGTRQLDGLLVTDGVTVPGDSGTLLYDPTFRAVGTLVGLLANESYFIPCDYALPALGVTLA